MDVCAIMNADDELLKDMGLLKAGDRLSLRGFCRSHSQSEKKEDNQSKKRRLLAAFFEKKKGKKAGPSQKFTGRSHTSKIGRSEKEKTKKVQLGWKHFKEEEEDHVLVPLSRGGGSRQVELPLSTNKYELMKTCKGLFFPDGKSIFGKEEEMTFDLANFKNKKIEVTVNVDGNELPFNINNYIDAHKVKNVRIYLLSQKLFDYDSEEDPLPVMDIKSVDSGTALIGLTEERKAWRPSPVMDIKSADSGTALIGSTEERKALGSSPVMDIKSVDSETALIGSTEERKALRQEQDKAYQESLNADRQKKIHQENEAAEVERRMTIQRARSARVPPEPDDNFVTAKVRHLSMGVCSRRFPSGAKMSAVYDWAGSLSPHTENFTLCDPFGVCLPPSSELSDRCTISMITSSETPPMSDSDTEVHFKGFGDTSRCSTGTEPDLEASKDVNVKERETSE